MDRKLFLLLLLGLSFMCVQPAKAAGSPATRIRETASFEEFSDEGAELAAQYERMSVKSLGKNGEFVSGRLVVKADRWFPAASYGALQVVKSPDNIYLMQFGDSKKAKRALAKIKGRPGVDYAEPDEYIQCETLKGTMTSKAVSWGASALGADKYAEYVAAVTSRKIKVAVIDSGVSSHPGLAGRLVKGHNYIGSGSDVSDLASHGTHVAGTIVDCTPGLKVTIMPVRVVNSRGGGYTSIIGMGIQYAVKHGAKVINISLGGPHSRYMDEQISYAVKKGVTVVVSSGNENQNTSRLCPAHIKKAIVVGAVDQYGQRAYFSNYGSALDVVAPGVDIVSTVPGGYRADSGTSMAAPHISAVAAMYKLVYPKKKPAAIEKLIKKNVKDLGSKGWDKYYGKGIPRLAPLAVPVRVKLNKKNATMEIGRQLALKAAITPGTAAKKTIKWKSSNKAVATVNGKGVITGKKTGTAVITATTFNGKKAACKVTVKKAAAQPDAALSVETGQQVYRCRAGESLVVDFTLNLDGKIVKNARKHMFYCGYLDLDRKAWMGLGAYDIDGSIYIEPRWDAPGKVIYRKVSGSRAQVKLSVDTSGMPTGQLLLRASIFPYAGFPEAGSLYDHLFYVELLP